MGANWALILLVLEVRPKALIAEFHMNGMLIQRVWHVSAVENNNSAYFCYRLEGVEL
jgi:hypothetical protein